MQRITTLVDIGAAVTNLSNNAQNWWIKVDPHKGPGSEKSPSEYLERLIELEPTMVVYAGDPTDEEYIKWVMIKNDRIVTVFVCHEEPPYYKFVLHYDEGAALQKACEVLGVMVG